MKTATLPLLALLLSAASLSGCAQPAPSATTHLEVRFAGLAPDVTAEVESALDSRPTSDQYAADRIPHPDGYTAHDQLEDWSDSGGLAYQATSFNSSFGAGYFLTSIGGVSADGMSAYWSLAINGAPSDVGMSEAVLHDGDMVTWTYTTVAAPGDSTSDTSTTGGTA